MPCGEDPRRRGGRPHPGQVGAYRTPPDGDGAARRPDADRALARDEGAAGAGEGFALLALIPLIPVLLWSLSAAAAWWL